MFPLLLAAAATSGGDESGVAIIGAIGALLVAVLGAIGVYIKNADARADRLSGALVADHASGEAQMRKERDEAHQREARAYKERDKWMTMWSEEQARANRLEIELTILRSTQGQSAEGT